MANRLRQNLGDGLVLRCATVEDGERLAAFHAAVHSDRGPNQPDLGVGAWVRDLMCGSHPSFRPEDFTLVEEAHSGEIVSSLCLISQTWAYEGVPFGVGQPELVSTRPDYRRRGLIRAQFEAIHGWSSERGEWVQAITGIPNYYRQFGYEMALTLHGGRQGFGPNVPRLEEGEAERFHVRPAAEADLGFVADVYRQRVERGPLACLRSDAEWRYELLGRSEANVNRRELCVVETEGGDPVGWLAHTASLWRGMIHLVAYELKPGVSWLAVTPAVVRYLWAAGEAIARREQTDPEAFVFLLGLEHPAYRVLGDRLPRVKKPYAWYLRVPNLSGFLMHIAPALERRLARSVAPGYTGELRISFYRDGLRLRLEQGRLLAAEPWLPAPDDGAGAAFPGLTFLQLLFGYRSLEELEYAFADCWAREVEARLLLEALFPKRPSDVWPMM